MISKIRHFLLLLTAFLSIQPLLYGNGMDEWQKKVSPAVWEQVRAGKQVDCLIYLQKQGHFRELSGSKSTKGRKVFDTLRDLASDSQSDLVQYLQSRDKSYKSYFIVNAISTRLDLESVEFMAKQPQIQYISLDQPVLSTFPEVFPESGHSRNATPEWGLQVIRADSVWALGITGENAVIGGQDTGYDWMHPALKNRYRGYISDTEFDHNYNWHDAIHEISPLHNDSIVDPSNNPCGLDVSYPCDDGSHGTHTMGTMVGLDGDNIIGVAPGARWIGVRNMERGWGKPSTYLEGFEWFLAPTDLSGNNPDPSKSPHVINNSWSCPVIEGCDSTNWSFMDIAINNLRSAGVVIVVSAGNNGNNCGRINAPPSMLEGSFAVAATQLVDTVDGEFIDDIAGYSSWGPVTVDNSFRLKPDISAPGSRVRSSVPGGYATSSGTSMAGPHVAGVVALMISANPSLAGEVETIEEIIQLTAKPMTRDFQCGDYNASEIPNFVFGYGRIDALEAVLAAKMLSSSAELPDESNFILFPNPTSGYLAARWNSNVNQVNARLYSIDGRDWGWIQLEKNKPVPLSFLKAGTYVLKTVIDHKIVSRTFLFR